MTTRLPKSALRRLPKSIPRITERQLEQTCTEFLELDGWRSLKTDPVSRREWGKGFGEKGMADYLYIRYRQGERLDPVSIMTSRRIALDQVMWIEWKRERGGDGKKALFTKAEKAKIHQLGWIAAERARGALVLLCGADFPPTIDGFQKWYRESGLCRRMR